MSRSTQDHPALHRAYQLESLLRVLSHAVDGAPISGVTFEKAGGGTVLDMAVTMAGEIVGALEVSQGGAA